MSEEDEYDYEYDEHGEILYYAVRPNKTQLKKAMAALFELSEQMSGLPPQQLQGLGLPEKIHKALVEVAGMPRTGARKRLLKYIAGLLQKEDMAVYEQKLARFNSQSAHAVREHHLVERWRDRLLADTDAALAALLAEHPSADRQQLRQLVRNAQKEAAAGKPPKSSRQLYRQLKMTFGFAVDLPGDELREDAGED